MSKTLKQWFLRCRFLRRQVITDHLNICNRLCNVFSLLFQIMTKIVLEKVAKELKILKVAVTFRY